MWVTNSLNTCTLYIGPVRILNPGGLILIDWLFSLSVFFSESQNPREKGVGVGEAKAPLAPL